MKKHSKCCNSTAHKQEAGNYFCSHCISICDIKYDLKPVFSLVLMLLLISIITSCKAPNIVYNKQYKATNSIDTTDFIPDDSTIYEKCLEYGSYFPEVACRQAKIECGIHYNSQVCVENKNLFGLRCNCKYVKGTKNGHSYYSSYNDCLKCYIAFTNRYWEKYCHNYAESNSYLLNLKKIK
jgi:hypothetical protein